MANNTLTSYGYNSCCPSNNITNINLLMQYAYVRKTLLHIENFLTKRINVVNISALLVATLRYVTSQ